jgi:hypothetical protein
MIKRTILFVAVCALSSTAHAERKYGLAGCGLGSVFFGKGGAQSSAATTNGLMYNQMFGITSGTSNCVPSGKGSALDERDQEDFFVTNFASLSKDVAKGEGETVVAFASILGCTPAVAPSVGTTLRDGYDSIFSQPGAVAAFDAARDTLRADAALSAQCAKL